MPEVPFVLTIKKSGGSYIVPIPKRLVDMFKINEGDFFLPFMEDTSGGKKIDIPNNKKYELSFRLKKKSELKDLSFLYFLGGDDSV